MGTNNNIHSDLPIPPGDYLEEVIEELGMTKDELAKRINRPAPKLSAIFNGTKSITPGTALELERAVGVPAHIWTGLEAEYRLALKRIEHSKALSQLKSEIKLVTLFRYADLVGMGVIEKFTKPVDKVLSLHKFFGVTSLAAVPQLRRYQLAFRKSSNHTKGYTPQAVSAWLRIGETSAMNSQCAPYNETRLRSALSQIRTMTNQSPDKFQGPLHKTLADAGVVLVVCPHMPRTGIQGATFWMGSEKAVVMMTLRYGWADIFWFSLFHELGHILLHGRNTVILEKQDQDPKYLKQEAQANRFAGNTLIPSEAYKAFISQDQFYEENITAFARSIEIDPGMVVGRLQHDGHMPNDWHNGLRKQLVWNQ
jgi:HTH-type transcriptional regulator / antitoxin HigA